MATHRIAVIPGDGIGKEVMPEGLRAVEAAAKRHGVSLAFTQFDWNCDHFVKHGRMMPEDWFETLSGFEAIYYGAVGWPATVPDHVSLWGSLIPFRRGLDRAQSLRHHFLADAVARNHRDAMRRHAMPPSCVVRPDRAAEARDSNRGAARHPHGRSRAAPW